MNTLKKISFVLLASTAVGFAQEADAVKKVIDSEKLENAKAQLKSILLAKPTNGKAAFLFQVNGSKQKSGFSICGFRKQYRFKLRFSIF